MTLLLFRRVTRALAPGLLPSRLLPTGTLLPEFLAGQQLLPIESRLKCHRLPEAFQDCHL